MSILPPEETYGDIELDLIDNEPPGLFPEGQDSYWGQVRKVFADYLQEQIADMLAIWYNNLDPRTVDSNDIANWESMFGLLSDTTKGLAERRGLVLARLNYGVFTRTQRQSIIESFLAPTFGDAPALSPSGLPLTLTGIPLYSGIFSTVGAYTITENIPDFSYTVTVNAAIDAQALVRALQRYTPAGINFTVTVNGQVFTSYAKSGGGVQTMKGGGSKNYTSTSSVRQAVVTWAELETP